MNNGEREIFIKERAKNNSKGYKVYEEHYDARNGQYKWSKCHFPRKYAHQTLFYGIALRNWPGQEGGFGKWVMLAIFRITIYAYQNGISSIPIQKQKPIVV